MVVPLSATARPAVIIVTLVTVGIVIVLVPCRPSEVLVGLRWILPTVVVILVVLVIVVLLRLLALIVVNGVHLFCWRHRVILVNDSEPMQLTVTTLLRVKHGGCLMTLGIDG